MSDLSFSRHAFSHSQIKSKMWLSEHLQGWYAKHMNSQYTYALNWYGSWVGIGPFILLSGGAIKFSPVRLYDLNEADLETSKKILNFWECEFANLRFFQQDVNEMVIDTAPEQLFINTACEHMPSDAWLSNLPAQSYVLLQSTDMPHPEHVNSPRDLAHFQEMYGRQLQILEAAELSFSYPDKNFKRFMIFGVKR